MNMTEREQKPDLENNGYELREYQKECVATVDNLPDGAKTIVCLATGMGKTLTAAHFKSKGRILWLSHRDELVRQPEKYYKASGVSYGIEKAGEHAGNERVVSASVQSLSRDDRLHRYKPQDFDIVICDEAHHAAAQTYKKILKYFKPRKLIGLTATPKRGDGVKLSDVFDDICFTRDLKWGIKNGYLTRIHAVRVSASFDFKSIKTAMGDLMVSSMSKQMLESDDDMVVTKAYMEYCIPEHKKTLIYCPTVNVCDLVYVTMLHSLNETDKAKIAVLSDRNSAEERKEILRGYETDKYDCIINCMILTEGTDLPGTSVIINNRPTANDSLYQQIIGRGTRLHPGKEYCLIIDVVGQNAKARNILTAPTLFGIDPEILPEKIRKELEKGDLLDLSEDILYNRGKAALTLTLKKELIDIFRTEREALIRNNRDKGYAGIAKAYEKAIEPQKKEAEFGDIMFKHQPEEDKYYCIPATYNGYIYISKPDLLDKSIVTVDIPKDESIDGTEWDAVSKPMPFEDAVKVVKDILKYSINPQYTLRWSRTARTAMNRSEATPKQIDYLNALYKDNIDIGGKLSKMQASDLIDLHKEIEGLKKKSKELKDKQNDKNTDIAGQEIPDDGSRNLRYKQIILGTYKKRKELEKEQTGTITIDMQQGSKHLERYPMSVKQRSYINSMLGELKETRKYADITLTDINMWQASVIIGALKQIKQVSSLPDDMEYKFKLKHCIEDQTGICEYELTRKDPYKFVEVG